MEDLKKLLAAATPGPWTHASDKLAAGNIKAADNAALIVAAVNALPELLALAEENARREKRVDLARRVLLEKGSAEHFLQLCLMLVMTDAEQSVEVARAALKEPGEP